MIKINNGSKYEIEKIGNNEFLIEFYVNELRCVMSFFYDAVNNNIYKKHLENIDSLTEEEIDLAHEYFYNKLEKELRKVCALMIEL